MEAGTVSDGTCLYVVRRKEKRLDRKWHDPSALRARASPSSLGRCRRVLSPRVAGLSSLPSLLPSLIIRTCNLQVQRLIRAAFVVANFVHSQSGLFPAPSSDPFDLTGSPYHSGRCHTWNPATPHTAYLDVKLQTRYITVCRSAASLRPRTWQTHKSRMVSGLELSTKP
jgi:hypothetical protein